MDNQKNNKGLIILLVVIIVILSVLCVLFGKGTISFNSNKINDSEINENNNDNNQINVDDSNEINQNITDNNIDSLALCTVSGGATFRNIPNGKYIDCVTGDVKNVSNSTLTVSSISKGNLRVYVYCNDTSNITGRVGNITTSLK